MTPVLFCAAIRSPVRPTPPSTASVSSSSHTERRAYLHTRARVGDVLDVAAPRGSFVIAPSAPDRPLVLMSAGVGITPVLAMLYSLAAEASQREVWWLYGARNS